MEAPSVATRGELEVGGSRQGVGVAGRFEFAGANRQLMFGLFGPKIRRGLREITLDRQFGESTQRTREFDDRQKRCGTSYRLTLMVSGVPDTTVPRTAVVVIVGSIGQFTAFEVHPVNERDFALNKLVPTMIASLFCRPVQVTLIWLFRRLSS